MTKEQIYFEWVRSENVVNKDSFLLNVIYYDSSVNEIFRDKISDFKKQGIDTFGLFKTVQVNQNGGMKDYHIYLFWQFQGSCFVQQFTHKATSRIFLIPKSYFITFFSTKFNEMKDDYILPPIYSGKVKVNKIEYKGEIVFHENSYTIFYQLGYNFKVVKFGQSYFENENSLFYIDNIATNSFHLFKIVEAEIKLLKVMFPD